MDKAPTTDQLRAAIDSGSTGEKVAFPDLAAAPLGTDAEAGGVPPTARERALETAAQTHHLPGQPLNGVAIYAAILVLVAAAILALVYMAI